MSEAEHQQRDNRSPSFIAWRFYVILFFILLVVSGLIARIFYLTVLDQHFLRHQGDERTVRFINTPAFRGMIVDRNGYPLAVSTTVYSVWINPQDFSPSKKELKALSNLLGMKSNDISHLDNEKQKKKREFVYVKRGVSPPIAHQIKALHLAGLYTQEEYKRYYPEGEVVAHVVGFTNVDDKGQEGLELLYNDWLQGEPGKKQVIKDRLGRVVSDLQTVQEQKPGRDLVLSIDRRIQYLAYRELLAGVTENKAASGSVVVLDTKTGEVLAMVNQPSFNPNNRPANMGERLRNRAVTDTFEPGSTIKAFTVATVLANGKFKPDTVIDTTPGWMRVGHNLVKDHESLGKITVTEALQHSSNIGMAKMILTVPADNLWQTLHSVGLGEETGIRFPGEQSGSLEHHNPWGAFTLATLAFGYGVSVTPLQLANAYNVLANKGVKIPLSLLKADTQVKGTEVMNRKLAERVLYMLESVLKKGGTAEQANVPGYRVAGKTGTALLAGAGGYQKHRYTSSFIGIAPLTNPRLIVVVMIRDPQGKYYYGGQVSGPVFQRVMEGALRILDVPPDAPEPVT